MRGEIRVAKYNILTWKMLGKDVNLLSVKRNVFPLRHKMCARSFEKLQQLNWDNQTPLEQINPGCPKNRPQSVCLPANIKLQTTTSVTLSCRRTYYFCKLSIQVVSDKIKSKASHHSALYSLAMYPNFFCRAHQQSQHTLFLLKGPHMFHNSRLHS